MARILMIDEDSPQRARLARALEGLGHKVVVAAEGEAARDEREVALVIANVFMSQKQGLDAIRRLREGGATMPIVALVPTPAAGGEGVEEADSGTRARDLQQLALELGATQVLEWPLEWEALRDEVQAALAS